MKTLDRIEQAANIYALNHSSAPDKETPDWIVVDYTTGARYWYNKAIEEYYEAIDKWLQDEKIAPNRVQVMMKIDELRKSMKI